MAFESLNSGAAAGTGLSAHKSDETVESIGPYSFIQKRSGQRLTDDSVLLAEFILPLKKDDSIIDLGTGTGAIPLMLAWKSAVENIVGIEIEEGASVMAERNVRANKLCERVRIIKGDFRDLPALYPEGSFSAVVSNPPYARIGSGRISPVKERAIARSEQRGGLAELLQASRHLAGPDGRIFYVFPVIRLTEMLDRVKEAGLKPRRLRFVHTGPKKEARIFLIEAGRTGELTVEEPVLL